MVGHILTINAGSSSVKCSLFALQSDESLRLVRATTFNETRPAHLLHSIIAFIDSDSIDAMTHRLVHGGNEHTAPCIITDTVVESVHRLVPFDPEHLPLQLSIVAHLREHFSDCLHIACFDTAFHTDMPLPAQLIPLPKSLRNMGIRRFGFHGLSYEYLLGQLRQISPAEAHGRIIMAHLGSGASVVAIRDGRSVETTMGLTPASGIPMSTRSGDIDPNLPDFLRRYAKYSSKEVSRTLNFSSGLLGISGLTSDMKTLIEASPTHTDAAMAVDVFCHHVKKTIGAYAAVLGGIDTIIFSGGIGEAAPTIRARVCDGLDFLGITLVDDLNTANSEVISASHARVKVRVIPTNEALVMAHHTVSILSLERKESV